MKFRMSIHLPKLPQIKIKPLSLLRNTALISLLILLGALVGYRQAISDPILGIELGFLNKLAQRQKNEAFVQLVNSNATKAPVTMDTFWEVWRIVERDYLDTSKIDYQKMLDGAISGMVWGIGDPYTTYLPPEDNEKASEDLAGSFYGVGIELGYIQGSVGVIAPLSGSPAERAGVRAGDIILHAKDTALGLDEDTGKWTLDDAVKNIRGTKGAPIILTLYQPGDPDSRDVEIFRDEIIVESVTVDFQEIAGKKIALLKISRFGERTKAEWDQAVAQILAKWAQRDLTGIVLDLRNNPGGYFDTSIDVASDFVKSGVVVSQKTKYTQKDFQTTGKDRLGKIPTVVLVNKGSASASEIVAGALRDDLGVKLIGEKTFGKGTVQDRRELSNGGGLHVTIGRWLTPAGNWIHDDGLPVDIEVAQDYETETDEVLERAVQEL